MKKQPKLIILNGFAGIGKSTIAKRYINEHPLALLIEGDEIIVHLGQWTAHEEKAREYIFGLTKSMISTHLNFGRDVIVPYLLTNASHAEEFEHIAAQQGAQFFEILLSVSKEDAMERLLERGTWGEADLQPITEKELPMINKLYDTMMEATAKRPHTISIKVLKDDIEHTYKEFLEVIGDNK